MIKYYEFAAKYDDPSVFVDVTRVPELTAVKTDTTTLTIGAAVTLNKFIQTLVRSDSLNP